MKVLRLTFHQKVNVLRLTLHQKAKKKFTRKKKVLRLTFHHKAVGEGDAPEAVHPSAGVGAPMVGGRLLDPQAAPLQPLPLPGGKVFPILGTEYY